MKKPKTRIKPVGKLEIALRWGIAVILVGLLLGLVSGSIEAFNIWKFKQDRQTYCRQITIVSTDKGDIRINDKNILYTCNF